MRLIVVYYNNMSPERVKSKRESMRNVERFSYVNTIAAENLNKIGVWIKRGPGRRTADDGRRTADDGRRAVQFNLCSLINF